MMEQWNCNVASYNYHDKLMMSTNNYNIRGHKNCKTQTPISNFCVSPIHANHWIQIPGDQFQCVNQLFTSYTSYQGWFPPTHEILEKYHHWKQKQGPHTTCGYQLDKSWLLPQSQRQKTSQS
jgi:hypothetical protein